LKVSAIIFTKLLLFNLKSSSFVKNLLMKNNTLSEIVFKSVKGIATAEYLKSQGVHYPMIKMLLEAEHIIKLKPGLYKWVDFETDESIEVAHIVPKGIVCLLSACVEYELTTFVPSKYHLAIPDDCKIVLPNYPPIQLYYWNSIPYQLGITTLTKGTDVLKIYTVEKTICDVVRYRNKIGMETVKEILKNYLLRKDRNLHQLNEFARILNIQNILHHYLELLI
jgi:predicted transcriptional regulator of viral defense system